LNEPFAVDAVPIMVANAGAPYRPLQDGELMLQGEILRDQGRPADKQCANEGEKHPHDVDPEASVVQLNSCW